MHLERQPRVHQGELQPAPNQVPQTIQGVSVLLAPLPATGGTGQGDQRLDHPGIVRAELRGEVESPQQLLQFYQGPWYLGCKGLGQCFLAQLKPLLGEDHSKDGN